MIASFIAAADPFIKMKEKSSQLVRIIWMLFIRALHHQN